MVEQMVLLMAELMVGWKEKTLVARKVDVWDIWTVESMVQAAQVMLAVHLILAAAAAAAVAPQQSAVTEQRVQEVL